MRKTRSLLIAPFDEAFASVRTAVHQALQEIEVDVFRFEDIPPGALLSKTISDYIRYSDFLVADISVPNPNVYYELGIARAYRKPAILIVKYAEEMKLPYDVVGYSYIIYDPSKLDRLSDSIKEAALRIISRREKLNLPLGEVEHA